MSSAAIHQAGQFSTLHAAQLHFYVSLSFGLFLCLMVMCGLVGLIQTACRRTQRYLWAATTSTLGASLIASSVVLNAFVMPKPHHFTAFIPTSGLGAILVASGFLVALVGIGLMPTGEAGKWLPVKEKQEEIELTDADIWPPAPKL